MNREKIVNKIEYFFSLGSNLGNKKKNLDDSIDLLKECLDIVSLSSIYRTKPVNMRPGTDFFLNMIIKAESSIEPLRILELISLIEKKMGRSKKSNYTNMHYEDRNIDIDILLAGKLIINTKELTIPHKEMLNRAFVIIPMMEIDPDIIHPVLNKPVSYFLRKLKDKDDIEKITDFR